MVIFIFFRKQQVKTSICDGTFNERGEKRGKEGRESREHLKKDLRRKWGKGETGR